MTHSLRNAFALALAWAVCGGSAAAQDRVGVRILLGLTDKESTRWDGSLAVRGAQVSAIEPWRFDDSDSITGNAWKAATHPAKLFLGGIFYAPGKTIVANGVVAQLSGAREDTTIDVTTAQGGFSFSLSQIPYGKPIALLDGRVEVDRVPSVTRLTGTPEEQDYPSVALDKSGNAWLAYVEFRHNKDHNTIRADHEKPITDFAALSQPTGGDQILVKHNDGQKWGAPVAITEPGLDLYRTAIAADGTGRVWVFWSQNDKGNFDIWARAVENGKPGTRVRITRETGADLDPVAVAAADGRVWVAWQGWRDGKASIFAARQQGSGFGAPVMVSSSAGNEWNPAIAADRIGRVTVAWDSYRKGNYDIFMRSTAAGGQWGPESAVAATARYEAYPSLAYDPSGRLWVAYEEGGQGWGKDFGAYNTPGVALYQGRVIRLRGFEPSGRVVETAGDLGAVLPGVAASPYDDPWSAQNDAQDLDNHRDSAKNRRPNQAAANVTAAHNNYPRLLVDASGRIWLAYRTIYPIWWAPMGTVWFEYVVSYDGHSWSKPVFLTHSDNLLDNRPALFSRAGGSLDIIGSSDWRSQYQLVGKRVIELEANMAASLLGPRSVQRNFPLYMDPSIPEDPYNNDLFANEISVGPARGVSGVPAVKDAAAGVSSPTSDPGESQAAQTLRAYRSPTGLRVMRGEFHRHSEISMDGAWDGSIIDQYRYMIDAAKMDWVGCCDHDNGDAREYSWWISQKLTDVFHSAKFTPMFSYERSVMYPEGHRNIIFAQRGVRPLPRLPITEENYTGHAPDTQMLYGYLKFFDGITASHTSATAMGTDWRDNDPLVEPVVEIYQGDRQNYEMPEAPRSNNGKDSIGGWRPKGFVNRALEKGYKLAFEASSDHISTHMSYCNLYVKDSSREAVLDAFKKRHVYAATDDILADVHSGDYMMGDAFTTTKAPDLEVYLKGTAPFSKVSIVKDNRYVYTSSPGATVVKFSWRDNSPERGKTSYYYVRGEQANGEIVWASPLWITYAQ